MARRKSKRSKTKRRSTTKRRIPRRKRAWISKKIAFLIREEGYPPKQAVAIAYSMAGVARKKPKKRSRRRARR